MEFPQRLGVEVIEVPVRYVDVIGIENFGAEDRRRSVPPRRPVCRLVEPGIDDQPLACSADLEAGMTNDTELHTRLFFASFHSSSLRSVLPTFLEARLPRSSWTNGCARCRSRSFRHRPNRRYSAALALCRESRSKSRRPYSAPPLARCCQARS